MKIYKCKTAKLVEEKIKSRGIVRSFVFMTEEDGMKIVHIDQPLDVIKSRMAEMKSGVRTQKLYLTLGMQDIDVTLESDGSWSLFDEFDVYTFTYDCEEVKKQ